MNINCYFVQLEAFPITIKMIVHKDEEGGYWGEVPSLPGCFSQGETLEEPGENMKEAVEGG